jgi:hypothetical protein
MTFAQITFDLNASGTIRVELRFEAVLYYFKIVKRLGYLIACMPMWNIFG